MVVPPLMQGRTGHGLPGYRQHLDRCGPKRRSSLRASDRMRQACAMR
jgi:hypothetical protein